MEETENVTKIDSKTAYELAYLLSPFVPADEVEKTMADIFARSLGAAEAVVVTEQAPRMRALAYSIVKSINNKNTSFRDAYFGWIKFSAEGAAAKQIKEALDKEANIIRFLIVHALKPSPKAGFRRFASDRRTPVVEGQVVNPIEVADKGVEMTKEEIDREIDTLLVGTEPEKTA